MPDSRDHSDPSSGVGRRDFFKGAALGAAGLVVNAEAVPAAGAASPDAQDSSPAPQAGPAPQATQPASDFMVDVLKKLDLEYAAVNPGSAFAGLHESLINHGGNTMPELVTCLHEETAMAMAHGYAKAAGKPMLVCVHGVVGLLHSSMALFQAWADRVPVVLIVGHHRNPSGVINRPHSAQDMGLLVRSFVKFDDEATNLERFAEATMRAAQAELSRTRRLVERGVYARARLDDDSATFQAAQAQTRAAQRRLDAARQGARSDQILAADARVAEAKAGLTEASAKLSDLAPRAPAAARVEEVFLQPGEWAAANQPVVALIPDARVFVRFFAPERSAAAYRPGQIVTFTCDGCAKALKAKITFISPRPEFTPPVIYSRETRDRLVFMVEAAPENPQGLVPGLPVDVTPLKPASRP